MSHRVSSAPANAHRTAQRPAHCVAPAAGLPGRQPTVPPAEPASAPVAHSPRASHVQRHPLPVPHTVDVTRNRSLVRRLPREQVEERSATVTQRISAPGQQKTFAIGFSTRPAHRIHALAVKTPEPRRYAVCLRELAPPAIELHRSPGRNSRQSVSRLAYLTAYDSAS